MRGKGRLDPRWFSYGSTSAVVTGMALVTGLNAAKGSRVTIIAGLLIFAIADNLTDSLSIHIYQESERLDERSSFRATLANFATRLCLSLSFVLIVSLVPGQSAVAAALVWGVLVLAAMTAFVARSRGASLTVEIGKHLALAAAVIVLSKLIGAWLQQHIA